MPRQIAQETQTKTKTAGILDRMSDAGNLLVKKKKFKSALSITSLKRLYTLCHVH